MTYKEWDNATLLHDAVGHNQLAVAKYLLDKGADVNALTTDGLTPLHMAAQNGNIEMTRPGTKMGTSGRSRIPKAAWWPRRHDGTLESDWAKSP